MTEDADGCDALASLALDLRWSWSHCTDAFWRQLDPQLWQRTRNPWAIVQTVSRDRLGAALKDPSLANALRALAEAHPAVSVPLEASEILWQR